MDFGLAHGAAAQLRTGCAVVGVFKGGKLSPSALALDTASGALRKVLELGDLAGEAGDTLLLQGVPSVAADRVLLVGLGDEAEFAEKAYRSALAAATRALRATGAADATLCLGELAVPGRDAAWKLEQAVLVVMDGLYRFDQLKTRPEKPHALRRVALHVTDPADSAESAAAAAAIDRALAIGEGIQLARDLGNMPGNLCTPAYLADQARELGRRHGLQVQVLERADLQALGMGAFLAVARGTPQPPKLVVMSYRRGPPGAAPVVLVGKGLTFDTGGISMKPAHEMDEMKFDMCGAAAVLGTLHAVARMNLPLHVVAIVPATENMPGGEAIKPGDVVTTMSGTTVEVLDTDAEGRLVLSDALAYAARFKPAAVVDVATLTGAIVAALGPVATGVFANDEALSRELVEAGERAWDRAWPLPLWDEYQDALKSNFADVPNIGSHPGDAVTAACFLSRFAKGYPWAHLDIAGTASRGGIDKGATGRPVALLAHFLARRCGMC